MNKGEKITIKNNEIFKMMGYQIVTGEIVHIRNDGLSFQCNETGCVETCDFNDGIILNEQNKGK